MKFIYLIIFCLFYSFNSHALEFSCIDKKYGRFSKMFIEDQLLKYEDEKGEPLEYKIVENSEKMLMAISKGSKDNDPILNYIFIIRSYKFKSFMNKIINIYKIVSVFIIKPWFC